ncbi:CNPV048 alkaline phosphodiesterase-like protein [Canarypox virus]|uniref:CNPV048 alkaline phosphodiesterase-like protein n=1 Tax=Canarypox virus TaxID=44088 RepID=Q6VZU9_CNPV|nr:CNPV048 alkaline phosphodiesterase-like protein [Canarypox virus]AAR83394.1 CNPV048 alkaline phosphodiesterase-like protein [Canarypox virus]AWD84524.1 alkaline phosphodiesterase-like protein [Canarypox virus]
MEDHGYQSDGESYDSSTHALYKDSNVYGCNSVKEEQHKHTDIFSTSNSIKKRRYTTRDIILYCLAVIAGISLIAIPLCLIFKSPSNSFRGCISFKVSCPSQFERPPLILVALDGFRYDYLKKWSNYTPAINELVLHGVSAPMRPVFPTNTFPNLYSIVTGLYPTSHGIVNNEFLDREDDIEFTVQSEETSEKDWFKGEPIWTTAMKQGVKAAAFFWPGSDKVRSNKHPTMFRAYNRSVSFDDRVEAVLKWLKMDTGYRPYLYTLYFEEPGATGLEKGPDSEDVGNAIKKVDATIRKLMDGLKEMNLIGCANIILVSDHGMSTVDTNKIVKTKELIKDREVIVKSGAFAAIRPKKIEDTGFFDYKGLISDMTNCSIKNRSFIVDYRSKLPKRLHYSNGFRVDILGVYVENGWQLTDEDDKVKYPSGGMHGGDNSFEDMTAIFVGYGPAFLNEVTAPKFDNIELYNVMCEIIGIKPANNNGTTGSLNHILRTPANTEKFPQDVVKESSCGRHSYIGNNYGCYCTDVTRTPKGNKRERANNRANAYVYNLPFGKPSVQAEDDYCILKNDDYVTAYSKAFRTPIWTSFTLKGYNVTDLYNETCYLQDMRIIYNINLCRLYKTRLNNGISFSFLYPTSNDNDNIQNLFETNTSPMYKNFIKIWELLMTDFLRDYVEKHGEVNVMVGPVFDNNSDGKKDSIRLLMTMMSRQQVHIPTDYFTILTSCKDSNTQLKDCIDIEVDAFVLPNSDDYYDRQCYNNITNDDVKKLINLHRVRVRDIELLTEMSFYRNLYKKSSNISFIKTHLD